MASTDLIQEIRGLTVVLNIDGNFKTLDLGKVISIDEDDLTKEFTNQASTYAYFAALQAKADHLASMAELDKDQEYAAADQDFRNQMKEADEKYTEGSIKSLIITDEKYQKACKKELDAKYEAKLLKAIVVAVEQRAQMLISLGSHIRHEMDMTGMSIRQRAFDKSTEEVKEVLRSKRRQE